MAVVPGGMWFRAPGSSKKQGIGHNSTRPNESGTPQREDVRITVRTLNSRRTSRPGGYHPSVVVPGLGICQQALASTPQMMVCFLVLKFLCEHRPRFLA